MNIEQGISNYKVAAIDEWLQTTYRRHSIFLVRYSADQKTALADLKGHSDP